MNLFIDTNIFLSFYHMTSEDLEELRKLAVLLEQKKVNLYLTDQVLAEFRRNREAKIADALKRLKEQRLNLEFPQLCKDYSEYKQLRRLQRNYEKFHSELMKKISEDVAKQTLKADQTIEELFNKAIAVETTYKLVGKARLRIQVGDPPGKEGSLGDAINWVALLREVEDGKDLYLIADDRDYVSALDENKLKDCLIREWVVEKQSTIVFYRRLSAFFKDKFPQIKLATELEMEILIRDLAASGSFAQTHSVVAKLSRFTDFTPLQVNQIVEAAISNRQVTWIISDPDVYEFLKSVTDGHEDDIEESNWKEFQSLLRKAEMEIKEEASEPPF
jgi:predicted nucleic acid-binding protein